jgi:alkylation response protein AidB-like acyl-CoA dehydrogenase
MYSLTEEQLAVQDLVRRVAREQVAPRADAIDRDAEYPQDMFDLLKELGLFALPLPSEYGGTGSLLAGCVAVEEFGRVCYNTGYLLVVQWVAFGALHAAGNAEQKARFLPGLASGELRGGSKIWCTNSDVADFVLVGAKCTGADGKDSLNLFIVEKGTPGFSVGRKEEKMGARGVPSCPLFFDDAFIPATNRMGPEGGAGFKSVMEAFNTSRPIVAARAVGIAQGAIDHATAFIQQRKAFGRKVADFQGLRWMMADMAMQTEAARQLTYKAASMVDAGVTGPELASFAAMAKCFASDVAMKVATDAVQMFGAAGVSNEYPINRYFRDAKVVQIIEGTNQIQRNIIANMLLGREQKA